MLSINGHDLMHVPAACLQLCKAAYFTNNTSLWDYASLQISLECSHSYMEKKDERNNFLSVFKDLPLPSPPWPLPCREQAVHATRVSENGKGACDSTFNVCCFSMPSSVFVSWGCTQAKPRKDFEQPSENPPPLCPGSWSCGTIRRNKKHYGPPSQRNTLSLNARIHGW